MTDYGPDYYHVNFGDGPLPLDKLVANAQVTFVILKFSQGTSYGDWAVGQAPRVRASRLTLGGYHMLDGDSSGDGLAQARYFLNKFKPQPGDIVPIVDFEGAGQGSASLASYSGRLLNFIDEVHRWGFEVMLYGHATVKAAFSDWRDSGADYWWVPGTSAHNDVGPRGPDLWQYDPYLMDMGVSVGVRTPAGNAREDVSKVITKLPVIVPVTPPPPPEEDMSDFTDYRAGIADYKANPDRVLPLPEAWPALKKVGYMDAKFFSTRPVPGTGNVPHKHTVNTETSTS